jgi:hypothetical protein
MSAFKPQQRHLTIRGRAFHFVSYEGRPTNRRRAQLPYPAMWYLMVEGRRCPVLPCDTTLSLPQLDAALSAWAEDNALGPVESTPVAPTISRAAGNNPRYENWWGPN